MLVKDSITIINFHINNTNSIDWSFDATWPTEGQLQNAFVVGYNSLMTRDVVASVMY